MGWNVKLTGLRSQIRRVRLSLPEARRIVVQDSASRIADTVAASAPRDTNRFVRAWFQGLRMVGGRTPELPPIQDSKHLDRIIEIIENQVRGLGIAVSREKERLKVLYPAGRPKRGETAMFRKITASIRKLERRYENARREQARLKAAKGAIMVGHLYSGNAQKGRKNVEIRDRVYGGSGSVLNTTDSANVQIRILEPHASFVEKRNKVWSAAIRRAGAAGGARNVGRRYFARLELAAKAGVGK